MINYDWASYDIYTIILKVRHSFIILAENPCVTGCPRIDPESKDVISCTSNPDVCPADHVCTEPKRDKYTVCCAKPTGT